MSRTETSTRSPDVLLIVPTRGERPDYLVQCLASLQTQTYERVTVVVVGPDDDALRETARRHGAFFEREIGRGLSAAINQGWRAHGEAAQLWAWLGDDDLLPPDSVTRAVGLLARHPRAVMVYGQCRYMDENGSPLWTAKPTRVAAWNLGGGADLVPQPGSMARAAAVRQVGMLDETLRFAMDYDLFLKLRAVGRLIYTPHVLASFRWHEGSLTASGDAAAHAEADLVRTRHRTGITGLPRRLLSPVTMKLSKLHWRLQHRPTDH